MIHPRRFTLVRDHDPTGVTGTGHVANGVQWPDGTATVRWASDRASTVHWDRIEDAIAIHGHGGATRIVWTDEATPSTENTTLTVPDGPKMLRETLCAAQNAIAHSPYDEGRKQSHIDRLSRLIAECDRHRPLGANGKHGDLHTPTCGCEDVDAGLESRPHPTIHMNLPEESRPRTSDVRPVADPAHDPRGEYVHLEYSDWDASGHECGDIDPAHTDCDQPVMSRTVTAVYVDRRRVFLGAELEPHSAHVGRQWDDAVSQLPDRNGDVIDDIAIALTRRDDLSDEHRAFYSEVLDRFDVLASELARVRDDRDRHRTAWKSARHGRAQTREQLEDARRYVRILEAQRADLRQEVRDTSDQALRAARALPALTERVTQIEEHLGITPESA